MDDFVWISLSASCFLQDRFECLDFGIWNNCNFWETTVGVKNNVVIKASFTSDKSLKSIATSFQGPDGSGLLLIGGGSYLGN